MDSMYSTDVASRVLREFGMLQGTRGIWEQHWQEIAERIWPMVSRTFNPYWYTAPGQKKNEFVYDSTAALALQRFSGILDSLLTPRNMMWHGLKAADDKLQKRRDVQLYFEDVTKTLFKYRYAPLANYSAQNQIVFKNLGGFGTGCMFIDEFSGAPGIRYRACFLGEIYISENHQGVVDKVFRFFALTARQAAQKWKEKCPERIRKLVETQPEQLFHFVHLVEPREDVSLTRRDFKGMKYASYYVSKEENSLVEEGGFSTFPYAVPRYEQLSGEAYGRSIAMDLLPAIKTLNEEKKTILVQGHRALAPVLLAHDDGVVDGFSLKPGAVNMGGVSAEGRPLVHALPTGDIKIGQELMEDERKLINDGFFLTLFQILTENPQQTATEVLERAREKGILLDPTIGRQESEYLGPSITRELDVLNRQGLLPPMPEALKQSQGEFTVWYDSPLTRASRSAQSAGLFRTVEALLPVVQATNDPTPLDYLDWDTITPEVLDIGGVPLRWTKTMEAVAAVKQNRQQAQQAEQMTNAAPGAAAMMNAATNARTAGQ